MGRTTTSAYYVIEPGVLAGVAYPGEHDNAATARENTDFYHAHFREHGPGVLFLFVDDLADQNTGARRTYREDTDRELVIGVSVIVGSMMARAMASFFLGISRPSMPFTITKSVADALNWARPLLGATSE